MEIVSIAFSAFALGFALCNAIWVFFGPSAQEERKRRKRERRKRNQNGNESKNAPSGVADRAGRRNKS